MNLLDALYAIFDSYFKSRQIELYSQVAKVTKVDKKSFSCDVELMRGGSRKFARLSAKLDNGSGFICFPKVSSNVIVSFLDSTSVFIVKYSEIDEIVFQDGINGGLVKVSALVAKLNQLETKLMSHQHLYIPSLAPAPAAVPTIPDPATNTPFAVTVQSEVENLKFKH